MNRRIARKKGITDCQNYDRVVSRNKAAEHFAKSLQAYLSGNKKLAMEEMEKSRACGIAGLNIRVQIHE